ncbi:hypothetical protein J007_01288 [Cryptococcus neoformans]|nr:hypothetical protein J007_01288 [Cryptococcus neoformans var. grubii]OXC63672.1 hypothetical protein C358_01288 [Cryptococcus neoformans var. grubii MW-RSA852]
MLLESDYSEKGREELRSPEKDRSEHGRPLGRAHSVSRYEDPPIPEQTRNLSSPEASTTAHEAQPLVPSSAEQNLSTHYVVRPLQTPDAQQQSTSSARIVTATELGRSEPSPHQQPIEGLLLLRQQLPTSPTRKRSRSPSPFGRINRFGRSRTSSPGGSKYGGDKARSRRNTHTGELESNIREREMQSRSPHNVTDFLTERPSSALRSTAQSSLSSFGGGLVDMRPPYLPPISDWKPTETSRSGPIKPKLSSLVSDFRSLPSPFPSVPRSASSSFGQSIAGPSSQSQRSLKPRRRSEGVHHYPPSPELPVQVLVEEQTVRSPRPSLDRQQRLGIPSPSLSDPVKRSGEQSLSATKGNRAERTLSTKGEKGKGDRFEPGGSRPGKKKAKHQSTEVFPPKGSNTDNDAPGPSVDARLSIESTGDEGASGRAFDMQWTPDNMKAYWMGYDSAMRDVKFGRGDVRVNMFQEGHAMAMEVPIDEQHQEHSKTRTGATTAESSQNLSFSAAYRPPPPPRAVTQPQSPTQRLVPRMRPHGINQPEPLSQGAIISPSMGRATHPTYAPLGLGPFNPVVHPPQRTPTYPAHMPNFAAPVHPANYQIVADRPNKQLQAPAGTRFHPPQMHPPPIYSFSSPESSSSYREREGTGLEPVGSSHHQRKRQLISCYPCRKRKLRCDGRRPVCEQCERRKVVDQCGYAETIKRRRRTKNAEDDDIEMREEGDEEIEEGKEGNMGPGAA